MIPKVIHYCWFGNNIMPRKVKKCIKSWRNVLSDYEVIQWDETNFDITENQYIEEAYRCKKWAFVADYARAKILVEHGGLYLDTDMLIIKRFDFALMNKAFCSFANENIVSMGLLGFEKNNVLMKEHLQSYNNRKFILNDHTIDKTTNVTVFSEMLQNYGMSNYDKINHLKDITIYPTDFFYPTDFEGKRNNFTKNTCAIHLHYGSWLSPKEKGILKIKRFLNKSGIIKFLLRLKNYIKRINK